MNKLPSFFSVCLIESIVLVQVLSGADPDFPRVILPFLEEYCVKCHGPDKKKGELSLHQIKDDVGSEAGSERWIEVLNQMTFDEMPPSEEKKRPRAGETADVVQWNNQRLAETENIEWNQEKKRATQHVN